MGNADGFAISRTTFNAWSHNARARFAISIPQTNNEISTQFSGAELGLGLFQVISSWKIGSDSVTDRWIWDMTFDG